MILIALLIFLAASLFSYYGLQRLSDQAWARIDYAAVFLGLIGVLLALAEVGATRKQQRIDRLQLQTQASFQDVMTRMEYLMEECGVWWNVVLDQTNKDPEICRKSHPRVPNKTCKETCRAGHFVMQHRRSVIGAEQLSNPARNLKGLVDQVQGDEFSLLRETTDRYASNAEMLSAAKKRKPLIGPTAQSLAQILIAIALGLEVGKVRHSARRQRGHASS